MIVVIKFNTRTNEMYIFRPVTKIWCFLSYPVDTTFQYLFLTTVIVEEPNIIVIHK